MRAEIGMRHSNCEKGLPYEVDSQEIHGDDGLGKERHLNDGIIMDRKDWLQTTSSRGIQSEEAVNPSRKAITCKAFDIARLLHSGIFLSFLSCGKGGVAMVDQQELLNVHIHKA